MLLNLFMNILDYWYVFLIALIVVIVVIIFKSKKEEEVIEYYIKLQTNCEIIIDDIVVPEKQVLPPLPILSRNGYNFKGWFLDEQYQNSVPKNMLIKENITVFAKWEELSMQDFLNQISTENIQKRVLKKIRNTYKDNKDN